MDKRSTYNDIDPIVHRPLDMPLTCDYLEDSRRQHAARFDGYLTKAWAPVVDLHIAFDLRPWSLNRTESDIITILNSREVSIWELERIANEAAGMENIDW